MPETNTLFSMSKNTPPEISKGTGKPRLVPINRDQSEIVFFELAVPIDHHVRTIWSFVETLDLGEILGECDAVEGNCGRPSTDPKILISLLLYGLSQDTMSSRRLARMTAEDMPVRWLCGGRTISHTSINNFRSQQGDKFRSFFEQSVMALMDAGVVTYERVAQDGFRVPAWAGTSSFKREATITKRLEAAKNRIKELEQEAKKDPGASTRREKAARQRAAEKAESRLSEALQALKAVREEAENNRAKHKKKS